MSSWRWPDIHEQREDYRLLRGCLADDLARRIAELPVVVISPPTLFALRRDAWLWRSSMLLKGTRP